MRWILRSKIHKAIVTDENLNYVGSMGIDRALMEKVDIFPGEKVLVVDNTNGARLETYVIKEEKNSGKIVIYGAACQMSFELTDKPIKAKDILVDKNNKFVRFL